jgi:hypothetical protein
MLKSWKWQRPVNKNLFVINLIWKHLLSTKWKFQSFGRRERCFQEDGRTINDTIKRVLIWHFTLVLIKINYGQIGDQTGLFYTTNPVFYTSGNRFVRRTDTFGNLTFSLVPSDNRNTRSTCPTSVFTGTGQTYKKKKLFTIASVSSF